jgi:hypothetical protein
MTEVIPLQVLASHLFTAHHMVHLTRAGLGDPTEHPKVIPQPRPDPLHWVVMHLTDAVTIIIPRPTHQPQGRPSRADGQPRGGGRRPPTHRWRPSPSARSSAARTPGAWTHPSAPRRGAGVPPSGPARDPVIPRPPPVNPRHDPISPSSRTYDTTRGGRSARSHPSIDRVNPMYSIITRLRRTCRHRPCVSP